MNSLFSNGIPNFRQIKSFLALARHLSFTRAAEELGISQPTLTVQIHQLEEMLSVKLFDRNRRQVRLTEISRGLLQPFEQLMTDMEAVMNFSTSHATLKNGTVRIAALPSVAATLLPKVIKAFNEEYPGIAVQICDTPTERITEMIKFEQIDFGIGTKLLPDKDISNESLLIDPFCAFFPTGHPLEMKKDKKLELKDCLAYPIIMFERSSSIRKILEHALINKRLEVSIAQETNYITTALSLVRYGLGVAILPYSTVLYNSMHELDHMRIASSTLHREVCFMRKAGKPLSPAAERFKKTLYDIASREEMFKKSKKSRAAHAH